MIWHALGLLLMASAPLRTEGVSQVIDIEMSNLSMRENRYRNLQFWNWGLWESNFPYLAFDKYGAIVEASQNPAYGQMAADRTDLGGHFRIISKNKVAIMAGRRSKTFGILVYDWSIRKWETVAPTNPEVLSGIRWMAHHDFDYVWSRNSFMLNVDRPIFCPNGKGAVSPGLIEMAWNGTITWVFDVVQQDPSLIKSFDRWQKACGPDKDPIHSGPEYQKFAEASRKNKPDPNDRDNVVQRWNQKLADLAHCNSLHMIGDTEVVWHCNGADVLLIVSFVQNAIVKRWRGNLTHSHNYVPLGPGWQRMSRFSNRPHCAELLDLTEDLKVVYDLCPFWGFEKEWHSNGVHGTVSIVPPFGNFLITDLNKNQTQECSTENDCFWSVMHTSKPKGIQNWGHSGGRWVSELTRQYMTIVGLMHVQETWQLIPQAALILIDSNTTRMEMQLWSPVYLAISSVVTLRCEDMLLQYHIPPFWQPANISVQVDKLHNRPCLLEHDLAVYPLRLRFELS